MKGIAPRRLRILFAVMRCPACRHPALEHDQACTQCGFSLDALAQSMGIPPMLSGPVADVAKVLSKGRRHSVQRAVHALHQRFPQVSFASVLADLSPEVPLALHAFWLFNKGSLFSAVERGGDNRGVLFLVDVPRSRAVAMIGYGLEPFVNETILEVCLNAASGSLAKEDFAASIESFIRELERQLTTIVQQLPQALGYVEDKLWVDSSLGEDVASGWQTVGGPDDLY